MTDETFHRIWIDLDTLLDTRLSTLHLLDPEAVPVCLANGYHYRPVDDWASLTDGRVDNDTFAEAYRDRETDVLKNALPTKMVLFLRTICDDLNKQRVTTPFVERVQVVVNIYPYTLSPDERTTLCAMVGHYAGEEVEVKTHRQDLDFLTPRRLIDDYSAIVIYNFDRWFRLQHKRLDSLACPRVSVFVPALFLKEVPDPDQLKMELSEFTTQDPFRLTEMMTVDRFNLQFLDTSLFSAIQPQDYDPTA